MPKYYLRRAEGAWGFLGVHSQPAVMLLHLKNYHYHLSRLPPSPQVTEGLNGSDNTCQKYQAQQPRLTGMDAPMSLQKWKTKKYHKAKTKEQFKIGLDWIQEALTTFTSFSTQQMPIMARKVAMIV